jgi:glucose-6-phosphate isomerase
MTWDRFKQHHLPFPSLGLALDISRVPFPEGFLTSMEAPMQRAFAEMQALEAGAIANPDEGRMVGHYWLRSPPRSRRRSPPSNSSPRGSMPANCAHPAVLSRACS